MAEIETSVLRIGSNDLVLQDGAARGSLANAYSASSTYAVGDYVLYGGQLYECNTAISTAEAWTAAHWTAVTVGGEIATVKDGLEQLETDLTNTINNVYATDTASGSIASFPDGADGVPVKSLTVDIEPVQSGSGDPSPTNIRPITGHTSAVVTVSPTTDAQDGTSYTIDLDGTRYGGTLDATTGVLTVDRQIVDLGTLTWILNGGYFKSSSLDSIIKRPVSNTEVPQVICSIYYPVNWNTTADKSVSVLPTTGSAHNIFLWVKDSSYTDAESFTTAMNGVQLCYTLATPFTVQLTAQDDITTVLGQNNVWADCGNVSVEYRADTKLYINKVLNA